VIYNDMHIKQFSSQEPKKIENAGFTLAGFTLFAGLHFSEYTYSTMHA